MILNNELHIEAPIARVWKLLDELEAVLPCMPGATYLGRNGDDEMVAMKLKVGAITSNFEGAVRFIEKDPIANRIVIRGAGKDRGGKASASASIEAQLYAVSDTSTRVSVKTDLALTGKLAQFGGGMIADISRRLIDQFAANLHQAVVQVTETEAATLQHVIPSTSAVTSAPQREDKPTSEAPPTSASAHPRPHAPPPSPTPRATLAETAGTKPLDVGGFVGGWALRQAARYVLIPAGMFAFGWICAKALT